MQSTWVKCSVFLFIMLVVEISYMSGVTSSYDLKLDEILVFYQLPVLSEDWIISTKKKMQFFNFGTSSIIILILFNCEVSKLTIKLLSANSNVLFIATVINLRKSIILSFAQFCRMRCLSNIFNDTLHVWKWVNRPLMTFTHLFVPVIRMENVCHTQRADNAGEIETYTSNVTFFSVFQGSWKVNCYSRL